MDDVAALDKLVERETEAELWASIGWARIEEPSDRNLDVLPGRFRIDFGCPECGAVWVDLLAAGYTSMPLGGGTAQWSEEDGGLRISPEPLPRLRLRAARIRCCEGHVYEYDSYTGKVRRWPIPLSWLVGGIATMAIGGLAYFMMGKNRK